jgi:hypothetical protein
VLAQACRHCCHGMALHSDAQCIILVLMLPCRSRLRNCKSWCLLGCLRSTPLSLLACASRALREDTRQLPGVLLHAIAYCDSACPCQRHCFNLCQRSHVLDCCLLQQGCCGHAELLPCRLKHDVWAGGVRGPALGTPSAC